MDHYFNTDFPKQPRTGEPRGLHDQVDRIMYTLLNSPEPGSVPDDGVSQSYRQAPQGTDSSDPYPQPRHWTEIAENIVDRMQREQRADSAQQSPQSESSWPGLGLISPAKAQVAIPSTPPMPPPGVPSGRDPGRELMNFLQRLLSDLERGISDRIDATKNRDNRTYETYTKDNLDRPGVYSGRTSGLGSPNDNVYQRGLANYPPGNYDDPRTDCSSGSYGAIRGREQQLIDHFKSLGLSDNQINGIWSGNPMRTIWLERALEECGHRDMPTSPWKPTQDPVWYGS